MRDAKVIIGYVRALFDVAVENGEEELYYKQIQDITASTSEDLLAFIENPAFNHQEKADVIRALAERLKLSRSVHAFFLLLAEHKRLRIVGSMCTLYRKVLFEHQGKHLMQITSATPLTEDTKEKITKVFSNETIRNIEIDENVDENLIGGVVVRLGSQVFDGSIRGRLKALRERLIEV